MSALGQKQTFAVQKRMSALPPIADIPGGNQHVRFVPIADIAPAYSITSSARASSDGGTVRPSALAVLRLITSYLVGACTGMSAGFSPLRPPAVVPLRSTNAIGETLQRIVLHEGTAKLCGFSPRCQISHICV
jgi:hypothetical protein